MKIINNKEIISIYNIVPNFGKGELTKFLGEKNTDIINKNLNKIKLVDQYRNTLGIIKNIY